MKFHLTRRETFLVGGALLACLVGAVVLEALDTSYNWFKGTSKEKDDGK